MRRGFGPCATSEVLKGALADLFRFHLRKSSRLPKAHLRAWFLQVAKDCG
jgi:hypothetical protein